MKRPLKGGKSSDAKRNGSPGGVTAVTGGCSWFGPVGLRLCRRNTAALRTGGWAWGQLSRRCSGGQFGGNLEFCSKCRLAL